MVFEKPIYSRVLKVKFEAMITVVMLSDSLCTLWTGRSIISTALMAVIRFCVLCIYTWRQWRHTHSLHCQKTGCSTKFVYKKNLGLINHLFCRFILDVQILILFHLFQWLTKFILLQLFFNWKDFSVLSCDVLRLWWSSFLKKKSLALHQNTCDSRTRYCC